MTLARKLMVVAAVALAVAAAAAIVNAASSGPNRTKEDSSSTKAYLQTRYSLEQASEADMPAAHAAVNAFITHVSDACPDVLRDAPQERGVVQGNQGELRLSTRNLLLLEIVTAVEVAFRGPGATAIGGFVDTVKQLRWSNPDLTSVVHSFGSVEAARLKRRVPDLCQDMKAWVASGYRHVPANAEAAEPSVEVSGVRLSNALSGLGCETWYPGRSILQLLTPYQHSSEGLTSNRVERLEAKVTAVESAILGRSIARIERVLGLPREERQSRSSSPSRGMGRNRPRPGRGCTGHRSPDVFPVPGSSRRLANPTAGQ
jgi:hypothetical protein